MGKKSQREHCCCFTGHRPEKLGLPEAKIKAVLKKEIRAAALEGYTVFISGMARGWICGRRSLCWNCGRVGSPSGLSARFPSRTLERGGSGTGGTGTEGSWNGRIW